MERTTIGIKEVLGWVMRKDSWWPSVPLYDELHDLLMEHSHGVLIDCENLTTYGC
jgi:hypothetical protein